MSSTFMYTSTKRLPHTNRDTQKHHLLYTKPWPSWTKAISASTFEFRMTEDRQKQKTWKDQTTQRKSNSTPKYTNAHLSSLSLFCQKHTERKKEIKPQGMTIVTVSGAPTMASTSASACSSSMPVWVNHKRCRGLVGVWRMDLLSSSLIFC